MRAWVEPITYCNGLATAWLARIYDGDDEPSQCWAELRPFRGSCVFVRETIDTVSVWALLGGIDRQAFKDMRRSMQAYGVNVANWKRARDYAAET